MCYMIYFPIAYTIHFSLNAFFSMEYAVSADLSRLQNNVYVHPLVGEQIVDTIAVLICKLSSLAWLYDTPNGFDVNILFSTRGLLEDPLGNAYRA